MNLILAFTGSFLASFSEFYLILILLKVQNILNQRKFWLSIVVLGFYVFISALLTNSFLKVLLEFVTTILLSLYVASLRLKNIGKVLITNFIVWVSMLIVELFCYLIIFSIISKYVNINTVTFNDNQAFKFISSALIFTIMAMIFNIKGVRKFCYKLTSETASNSRYVSLIIISSVLLFSLIVYLCLFNYKIVIVLPIIFFMIVIYTIVVIMTLREISLKNKIQVEHDILLTNLSEYENLLDRQRILNHENKNQLLVIKGMITKNEDVESYIDSLIDNQYKDSDELISKTNRIPSGGLKGLVYYKMLIMKDRKINVSLEVNSSVNKIDFSSISPKTNQELCKIIGVFLDNAIEEVENLKSKNINIVLENEHDNLLIKISNNYGYSDINNIGEKGYTTKGSGHGYGLRLVKSIIDNNKLFEHKTEINGKVFSQIMKLKIKMTD